MTKKAVGAEPPAADEKTCFVIMPISDVDGYSPGHFNRVYEFLLERACKAAGFTPILASRVQNTNLIVLDILRRILNADMVLCDLSARNPNVLFELGIRQAFNKPVTLVKDKRTPRIFDVTGLRDVEYDESMRVDLAESDITDIATMMRNTYEASKQGSEVNSLIKLLSIEAAAPTAPPKLSGESQLLLGAIREVGDRVSTLEQIVSMVAAAGGEFRMPSGRGHGVRLGEGLGIAPPVTVSGKGAGVGGWFDANGRSLEPGKYVLFPDAEAAGLKQNVLRIKRLTRPGWVIVDVEDGGGVKTAELLASRLFEVTVPDSAEKVDTPAGGGTT